MPERTGDSVTNTEPSHFVAMVWVLGVAGPGYGFLLADFLGAHGEAIRGLLNL